MQRRIEAIREGYERWNSGDYEAVARGYHDDVVFRTSTSNDIFAPETIRDREALARSAFAMNRGDWAELRLEAASVEELDPDHYLVKCVIRARGARSGLETSRSVWSLYEYRGPKVAKMLTFDTHEEAIAAYREPAS